MINVLICGAFGKMGANVYSLLKDDENAKVVAGVDVKAGELDGVSVYDDFEKISERIDVIIDFSSPTVLEREMAFAKKVNCAVVLATTGYTKEQLAFIDECAKLVPVFKTANFSLGVNLIVKLAKKAAEVLGEDFDVEIIEKHHNQKVDAPSGTALMLADAVNEAFDCSKEYLNGREGAVGKRGKEIGIHAVRGGTIAGDHDVLFCGEDEIVGVSHSARSKKIFASGAIKAAKWIAGKPAGKYDMTDLLGDLL